jgi:hypothetical protein
VHDLWLLDSAAAAIDSSSSSSANEKKTTSEAPSIADVHMRRWPLELINNN